MKAHSDHIQVTTRATLSERTLWLMAAACGISVANICYNQPMIGAAALIHLLGSRYESAPFPLPCPHQPNPDRRTSVPAFP